MSNEGGPAFPGGKYKGDGMSLRDWYRGLFGAAYIAMHSHEGATGPPAPDETVAYADSIADAMLERPRTGRPA